MSPIFDSPMIGKIKPRTYIKQVIKVIFFNTDGGYDIRNFTKVNPIFGTDADLDALFKKAKELGIKIILDFVS